MYGRLRNSASVCLKCQYRLRKPVEFETVRVPFPFIRWQTQPAIRRDPEQQDDDDGFHDAPVGDDTGLSRHNGARYRRWKPHNATQLGVESLGAPAEVLILPSRERKILDVPVQTEEKQEASIQSDLEIDFKPVSWDDVKNNIIAVKNSLVAEASTHISDEVRKALTKTLADSFTRNQLKRYLQENTESSWFSVKHRKGGSKAVYATDIMTQVWEIDGVKDAERKEVAEDQKPETKTETSQRVTVDSAALSLALLGGGVFMRQVSELYQVQIDVFRENSYLSVTGKTEETVRRACKHVRLSLKKPPSADIALTGDLQSLAQNSAFDGFLNFLMQKYAVRIVRRRRSLSLSSLTQESLDLVRQELFHVTELAYRNAGYSFPDGHDDSQVVKARTYPSTFHNWFLEKQSWYRYVTKSKPQYSNGDGILDKTQREHWSAGIQTKLDHENPLKMDRVHDLFLSKKDSLTMTYNAEIGQALSNADRAVPSVLQSAFCSETPLLIQYLSDNNNHGISRNSNGTNTCIMLRFYPCERNTNLPGFDIFMTAEDAKRGLKQPLQMKKIVMNFGSVIHDALLPAHRVDVRFRKELTLELFNSSKSLPLSNHVPFLKTIGIILEDIQNAHTKLDDSNQTEPQPQQNVRPVFKLNLLPLLKDAPKLTTLTTTVMDSILSSSSQQQQQATDKTKQSQTTTSKATARSPASSGSTLTSVPLSVEAIKIIAQIRKRQVSSYEVSYALEPPTLIDCTSYTHSSYSDFVIEHQISRTVEDNQARDIHSLQILHTPSASASPLLSNTTTTSTSTSTTSTTETETEIQKEKEKEKQKNKDQIFPQLSNLSFDLAETLSKYIEDQLAI